MIVLSDTKPKARKDHRCSCCLGLIRKGVTYSRTTCIYDGRMYDWLSCPGCDDIASAVFNWIAYADEGVTADDYDEWARDHQDDTVYGQGARAYLARRHPPLPLCPECVQGKPGNCHGQTLDAADEWVPCATTNGEPNA